MKTRMVAIVLTVAMLLSCSMLSVYGEREEDISNDSFDVSDVSITAETGAENEANTYASYMIEHSSADIAKEKVTVYVNKEIAATPLTFTVSVPTEGLYTVGMSYKATGYGIDALELMLKVDDEFVFDEAQKLSFPRIWQDEESELADGNGNEFAARQIHYDGYRFSLAYDITQTTAEPYYIFLTAGTHQVTVSPVTGSFTLDYFEFGVPETYETYKTPYEAEKYYSGESIVIEAEKPLLKNSYWLTAKTDNSSINITPNDPVKSIVNYVGGGNWKTPGETIVWETPELEEGYYQLGFSFRQNEIIGGKSYRMLTIDGKIPFEQASHIGFTYDDNWQQAFFADDNDVPYLIYLTSGKHEIALTVVPGEIEEVQSALTQAVETLGSLYIDMTMITGETVDIYRSYDLFSQIPDMKEKLENVYQTLYSAAETLKKITGQKSGSQVSVIQNMYRVVEQMLNNRYTAHRYKDEYYNCYTSVAATLSEMQNMPLDLDKLILTAVGEEAPFKSTGFFARMVYSLRRFISSFVEDYSNISGTGDDTESLTLWVNWGRDQAQVLTSLIQRTFTPDTGISVNIQLVNASIVQAILSGKGPDIVLQQARSEPVNLAMRGVLYDLTQFDDLDSVLSRFREGADVPYRYNGGLYALPDTQDFYLMYYRKDILDQLGLSVPNTWDEFKEVATRLARKNLQVWMPNSTVSSSSTGGIGTINLFPTLLLQNDLDIYSEDGRSTNLSNPKVVEVFTEWTDFYSKLKLPLTMDFYNRFRSGTCPIGISNYTLYTTLKAAAPEIDGLWNVASIPGTVREDGTVSHISSGGGSGCSIMKYTKNPEKAWEFLKWWTDAETQLSYSNEVEAVLGPSGRVAVSNTEAFKGLTWDNDMLQSILTAWEQVREIPEYPGSYYVSRSLYQSFWNVVNDGQVPKDMLTKYGRQADQEIERKWKQYENR